MRREFNVCAHFQTGENGDAVRRLRFDSCEEAVAYAEKHSLPYRVDEDHKPALKPKAYSDNFAYRRRAPWTH